MTAFFREVIVKIGYFAAGCIILAALLVSTVQLFTPYLEERHLSDIENWASHLLERPVTISHIHVSWNLTGPRVALDQVTVLDQVKHIPVLQVPEIKIGFNLWRSLIQWRLAIAGIRVSGVHLTLHQTLGQIHVEGLSGFAVTDNFTGQSLNSTALFDWIFSQPYLSLRDIEISFVPAKGAVLSVTLHDLVLKNSGDKHALVGQADLNQGVPTKVDLTVKWQGNAMDLPNVSADLNVSLQGIALSQWFSNQSWHDIQVKHGLGSVNIQARWEKNIWKKIQSTFQCYNLEALSLQPAAKIAANDLSGVLSWDGTTGDLKIDGRQTSVALMQIFAGPLQFDQLGGKIHWQKDNSGNLTFAADNIRGTNADLNVHADMSMTLPVNDSPTVKLSGDFAMANAGHIAAYLPLKTFSSTLAKWLINAFSGGQLESGRAILQGRLSDFPFDHAPGTFMISGKIKDLDLNYAPGWPLIRHINGNLVFAKSSMKLDVITAEVLDMPLNATHAEIPDIGKDNTILNVQGGAQTDMAQGLRFIRESPLKKTLGKDLGGMQLQGPMQLVLGLSVPLDKPENTTVNGSTAFDSINLSFPAWNNLTLRQMKGMFHFTRQSLEANAISGRLFDQPATLTFATDKTGKVTAELQGNLSVSSLQTWLKMPLDKVMRGSTAYQAKLQLQSGLSTHLLVHSDLKGVSIDLPSPYGKKADSATNFLCDITTNKQGSPSIVFSLDKMQIQIAKIPGYLQIGLDNTDMSGQLLWPLNSSVKNIQAKFQRLYLHSQGRYQQIDPKKLFGFSFVGNDVRYDNKSLGQVTLTVAPDRNGIVINQLNLDSSLLHLHAQGSWRGNSTHLQGGLTAPSVSRLLEAWGYASANPVGSSGDVQFDLSWPSAPYNLAFTKLSGTASLNLGEGRIINLSASTNTQMDFGRMLNVFSLQTIPRRLSLDFSDVFQKGYNFDFMKGSFKFANGNAYTQDTRFDGSLARVDISGRIGISAKDFDMKMSVTPHVTTSLPMIATIATGGNPIVGIAAWMLGSVAGRAGVGTHHYSVTGSWSNPVWSQINGRPAS